MRTQLSADRVARFVGNLERLMQQWQVSPLFLAVSINGPEVRTIRGWLTGKRPSERSVRVVAGFFGFDDHCQLLDRDISYKECENMRQAKENAEAAAIEREDEERQQREAERAAAKKASLSGDPIADKMYATLMAHKFMRSHVVVQLGMLTILLDEINAVGCG